jgi:asparagine synthase (glutamine-hydrolysing)
VCGIVGIYSFKENTTSQKPYINWCLNSMHHRGPDSNGIWQHNNYITGFVRLAIRDVSESGSQPMVSACGNYCITFNGEIYNADDFKDELIGKGVQFKSTSDTEILLYALIHFGLDVVLQKFDGMYAFAFYNVNTNEVVVARDRLGIKPLYIGFNEKKDIIYSSQYNHIINFDSIANESIDASVMASYLQLGFVADGMGIIHNTQLLPHGYYIKINSNGYFIEQYYKVLHNNNKNASAQLTEDEILQSVQSQLISDVPVGTFMSGGIDSSLITLLANKNKSIKAYTISTGEATTDEKEKAEWFTQKFNISHSVKSIDIAEFEKIVQYHAKAYTEPFADFSSIPSLLVSKIASEEVKVVLSGDGPDELFWGYARNVRMIEMIQKFHRSKFINLVDYLLSKVYFTPKKISKQLLHAKTFASFYYNSMFMYGSAIWSNKILPVTPKAAFFHEQINNTSSQKESIDVEMNTIWNYEMNIHLQRILLKMDRASMYSSLESRVPYLSNKLVEIAANTSWKDCIISNQGKDNVKKILANYTGNEFVYATKKGFDIPIHQWINGNLKKNIESTISSMPSELKQYFDLTQLNKMLQNHFSKKEQNGNMIWAVYVLINWYNEHRNSYKLSQA